MKDLAEIIDDVLRWIARGLLSLTLTACAKAGPAPGIIYGPMDKLDGRPPILVIGDSISWGYLPYVQDGIISHQVIHAYSNNRSTRHGIANIESWISHAPHWSICTINHGLWDIEVDNQVPLAEYLANLEFEINLLKGSCDRVIFMRTTRVDDSKPTNRRNVDVNTYNAHATYWMDQWGIQVCDLNLVSQSLTPYDDVHYNELGYQSLANEVINCIGDLN